MLELLIALALGLLVLGAVLVSASGMVVSARQQRALSIMTEDAMLALSLIRRDLQMAGYVHPAAIAGGRFSPVNAIVQTRAVFGCSTSFTNPQAAPGQGACNSTGSTDQVEINFEATNRTVPISSQGRLTDCQGTQLLDPASPGNLVPVATEDQRIPTAHRYFVQVNTRTQEPELYCASSSSTSSQSLVAHVKLMQVTYGVANGWTVDDPSTRRPVRYVTADQVIGWSSVVAVRVCVLMQSDRPVLDRSEVQTLDYLDCNGNLQRSPNMRLHRSYVTTVGLRNKVAW